jgi:hypothetical protein
MTVSISWNSIANQVLVTLCSTRKNQAVELNIPYGGQRKMQVDLEAGKPQSIFISGQGRRETREVIPA